MVLWIQTKYIAGLCLGFIFHEDYSMSYSHLLWLTRPWDNWLKNEFILQNKVQTVFYMPPGSTSSEIKRVT